MFATDAAHYLRTRDYIVIPEGEGAWRVGTVRKTSEELIAQAERERRLAQPVLSIVETETPSLLAQSDESPRRRMLAGDRLAIAREVQVILAELKRLMDLLER